METLFEYAEKVYNSILDSGEPPLDEKAYKIINSFSFEELINNDFECLNLIYAIIEDDGFYVTHNKRRASHIIITWLLGIGLGKVFGVDKLPREKFVKFLKTLDEINYDTIVEQWEAFQS